MRFLLLFFIVIPLVEMSILFAVSDQIGGLSTIGLVVLTAVVGVQILKRQGLSTLLRANERLNSGQLPAQEIVEGMMLAASGVLLLTPGFLTDTLGFTFLLPPARHRLAALFLRWGVLRAAGGGASFTVYREFGQGQSRDPGRADQSGTTVEGEYSSVEGEIERQKSRRDE